MPNDQAKTTGSTRQQDNAASLQIDRDEADLTSEYRAALAQIPAEPPSGGDFHASFPVNDGSGKVAVVVGDVAGHGPEQTAQAEHMRELLSDCLTVGLSPEQTLEAVNALVEPDPHFEGFGTVFVGKLEAETGKLSYASGGHEPALIAPPAAHGPDSVAELETTGPPVGVAPPGAAHYESREASIPEGGTLLLYTDGLPDARPPRTRREWFGLNRLKKLLAALVLLPPRRLVSRILSRVISFCRGRFQDDVVLLAIRRAGAKRRRVGSGKDPGSS